MRLEGPRRSAAGQGLDRIYRKNELYVIGLTVTFSAASEINPPSQFTSTTDLQLHISREGELRDERIDRLGKFLLNLNLAILSFFVPHMYHTWYKHF